MPAKALFTMALALGWLSGAGAGVADTPTRLAPRPLSWAERAADRGDWGRALQIAERDGPVAVTLIRWRQLRAGQGSPEEVLAFLRDHPDWPGEALLRRRSEAVFAAATSDQIIAFFTGHPPGSGFGAMIYAEALQGTGAQSRADAVIANAWRTLKMNAGEQQAMRDAYPQITGAADAVRMDMLFWSGAQAQMGALIPLLPDALQRLARARELSREGSPDAAAAIQSLPDDQRSDPGIAYALFRALIDRGQVPQARALMIAQGQRPEGLGDPAAWAGQRQYWARTDFQDGDYLPAYTMAADNQLTSGADFADMEWLAGYIALRELGKPKLALFHFNRLRDGVTSPISLGRAWYWIGRANAALGQQDAALAAWKKGAEFQTSFYGQLSAERAGLPFDTALSGDAALPMGDLEAIRRNPLVRAAMLLKATGRDPSAELFIMKLASGRASGGLEDPQLLQLAAFLRAQGDMHLLVRLGKTAVDRGLLLPRAYFPLHPLAQMKLPIDPAMALSIARRESEFDPQAASPVGARGLMQLMPDTANKVASDLGLEHGSAMLTQDWRHNVTLGSAYLAELAQKYGGNVMLVSAAYNAGPDRVDDWIATYGDPRDPKVDPIDWAEEIPYRETRNYVQRVAESLPIYRARLGRPPHPVPFSTELGGSTLLPLPKEGE